MKNMIINLQNALLRYAIGLKEEEKKIDKKVLN